MSAVSSGNDDSDAYFCDVIVLGAGISGLVSTSILLKEQHRNVVVVDEYARVGGNHIDCSIGDYTFDVGSFIFQDDSPLLRHLPEILPSYIPINPSWGRLNPQGVVTRYPISIKDDIVAAGPLEWFAFLFSALYARIFCRRLRNARDFARYWIGARLVHRSGLAHYMERFYGLPPQQIDVQFAEKRMLWVKERASLRGVLSNLRPLRNSVVNTQLARPREGFAHLYRAAVERMRRSGARFILGAKLHRLQKKGGLFVLEAGGRRITAPRVVSTIPLEQALKLCGIPIDTGLQTVTLISLFFSFSGDRGFRDSILYNFSETGLWKRLTVSSDFYGLSAGREFFSVEVNADHVLGSAQTAEQDFRRHAGANGLFIGDLHLEGTHVLSNAYPIYAAGAAEKADIAIAALRIFGVESLGRQGGFDYQPTARVSTLNVEDKLSSR